MISYIEEATKIMLHASPWSRHQWPALKFPALEHGALHFLAASPKRKWYQHRFVCGCEAESGFLAPRLPCCETERSSSNFFKSLTSARRELISACRLEFWESATVVIEELEVDASMILSASSANCWTSESVDEATTIRTFDGRRCKNSSLNKALSVAEVSPLSKACIRRNKRVGLESPNSSPAKSCCRRLCSEVEVLWMSCYRSVL